MIIHTRYRDIPASQIQCRLSEPERWPERRGRPISIQTPAVDPTTVVYAGRCTGPFFIAIGETYKEGYKLAVCPHIAEIGD